MKLLVILIIVLSLFLTTQIKHQTEKQIINDYTYILEQDTVRCHLIGSFLISNYPYILKMDRENYIIVVKKYEPLTGESKTIGLIYFYYSTMFNKKITNLKSI